MKVVYGDILAKSADEYMQVLHDLSFDHDDTANTVLCSIANVDTMLIKQYNTAIVYDWFGIDDPVKTQHIDRENVIFITTNMRCEMTHAKVVRYNFMRNRSLLMYTETFPITRSRTRYHLLLSDSSGKSYIQNVYSMDRNKDFLYLNARRQTPERDSVEAALAPFNGYISSKNNKFADDPAQPYAPPSNYYFNNSYYNIVVETNLNNDGVVHTTEKIWEPIIKYQIPIVLATKNYQEYMESLGFVFPIPVFTDVDTYIKFLIRFFSKDTKLFFKDWQKAVLHNNELFFKLPFDQSIQELY